MEYAGGFKKCLIHLNKRFAIHFLIQFRLFVQEILYRRTRRQNCKTLNCVLGRTHCSTKRKKTIFHFFLFLNLNLIFLLIDSMFCSQSPNLKFYILVWGIHSGQEKKSMYILSRFGFFFLALKKNSHFPLRFEGDLTK